MLDSPIAKALIDPQALGVDVQQARGRRQQQNQQQQTPPRPSWQQNQPPLPPNQNNSQWQQQQQRPAQSSNQSSQRPNQPPPPPMDFPQANRPQTQPNDEQRSSARPPGVPRRRTDS